MGMYAGHFDFTQRLLWTVPDLFSVPECQALADAPREWLPATVNRAEGRVVQTSLRDSSTAVLRDAALAAELHRRMLPHVPAVMHAEPGGQGRIPMRVVGVHLPLRIYRYEPGQQFGPHEDQSYSGENGAISLLTLMVYLNDDFEGGETEFPDQQKTIVPRTGMALLFQHRLLHAGRRVCAGTKRVLRSDVLYRASA